MTLDFSWRKAVWKCSRFSTSFSI